jgi:transcriptional regulator with XRE-family HTH domain
MDDAKVDVSGRKVREQRGLKRWTQEGLAGTAGVSLRTISKVEKGGRHPIDTVAKIALALGARTEDLLVRTVPEIQSAVPTSLLAFDLLNEALIAAVQSVLRWFLDEEHGGFFYAVTRQTDNEFVAEDLSKRLEDSSLVCWALLEASKFLSEPLREDAVAAAIQTLSLLHDHLGLRNGLLVVAQTRDWRPLHNSFDLESEDLSAYIISCCAAFQHTQDSKYKKRALLVADQMKRVLWDKRQGAFSHSAEWHQQKTVLIREPCWANVFSLIAFAKLCGICGTHTKEQKKYSKTLRAILTYCDSWYELSGSTRQKLAPGHSLFPNALYLYGLVEANRMLSEEEKDVNITGGEMKVVEWILSRYDPEHGGLINADAPPAAYKNALSIAASCAALNEWHLFSGEVPCESQVIIDRVMITMLQKGMLGPGMLGRQMERTWQATSNQTLLASQAWLILALVSFLKRRTL